MGAMYLRVEKDWKENFMFYASAAIIVCTCLGGVAVYSIFQHGNGIFQMLQLFPVIVLSTAVLASILTVQKPNKVLYATIASIIICALIILLNLIF